MKDGKGMVSKINEEESVFCNKGVIVTVKHLKKGKQCQKSWGDRK